MTVDKGPGTKWIHEYLKVPNEIIWTNKARNCYHCKSHVYLFVGMPVAILGSPMKRHFAVGTMTQKYQDNPRQTSKGQWIIIISTTYYINRLTGWIIYKTFPQGAFHQQKTLFAKTKKYTWVSPDFWLVNLIGIFIHQLNSDWFRIQCVPLALATWPVAQLVA